MEHCSDYPGYYTQYYNCLRTTDFNSRALCSSNWFTGVKPLTCSINCTTKQHAPCRHSTAMATVKPMGGITRRRASPCTHLSQHWMHVLTDNWIVGTKSQAQLPQPQQLKRRVDSQLL